MHLLKTHWADVFEFQLRLMPLLDSADDGLNQLTWANDLVNTKRWNIFGNVATVSHQFVWAWTERCMFDAVEKKSNWRLFLKTILLLVWEQKLIDALQTAWVFNHMKKAVARLNACGGKNMLRKANKNVPRFIHKCILRKNVITANTRRKTKDCETTFKKRV